LGNSKKLRKTRPISSSVNKHPSIRSFNHMRIMKKCWSKKLTKLAMTFRKIS